MGLFDYVKKGFDYFPIVLIALLFVSETKLEEHAFHISCKLAITIACLSIFFLLVLKYENGKPIAFVVALMAWVLLITLKKRYLITEIPNLRV